MKENKQYHIIKVLSRESGRIRLLLGTFSPAYTLAIEFGDLPNTQSQILILLHARIRTLEQNSTYCFIVILAKLTKFVLRSTLTQQAVAHAAMAHCPIIVRKCTPPKIHILPIAAATSSQANRSYPTPGVQGIHIYSSIHITYYYVNRDIISKLAYTGKGDR